MYDLCGSRSADWSVRENFVVVCTNGDQSTKNSDFELGVGCGNFSFTDATF